MAQTNNPDPAGEKSSSTPKGIKNTQADNKAQDPRHLARRLALQFLHQLTVQDGANLPMLESFLNEYISLEPSRPLARRWIQGTWQNREQIDQLIRQVSTNWDLSRICLVDRSNLRLAVYQLLFCPDIPAKVVINEAIELAKTFSTAQAPAFINGILDVIHHQIKQQTPIPTE